LSRKADGKVAESPRGNGLSIRPHQVQTSGWHCVGVLQNDSEVPESTKNLKLLCLSIKFFAGRKDIAVAGASIVGGGGRSAGVSPAVAVREIARVASNFELVTRLPLNGLGEHCGRCTAQKNVQKLELLHYEDIFQMAAHEHPQDGKTVLENL
jgi:hypothetical protein